MKILKLTTRNVLQNRSKAHSSDIISSLNWVQPQLIWIWVSFLNFCQWSWICYCNPYGDLEKTSSGPLQPILVFFLVIFAQLSASLLLDGGVGSSLHLKSTIKWRGLRSHLPNRPNWEIEHEFDHQNWSDAVLVSISNFVMARLVEYHIKPGKGVCLSPKWQIEEGKMHQGKVGNSSRVHGQQTTSLPVWTMAGMCDPTDPPIAGQRHSERQAGSQRGRSHRKRKWSLLPRLRRFKGHTHARTHTASICFMLLVGELVSWWVSVCGFHPHFQQITKKGENGPIVIDS